MKKQERGAAPTLAIFVIFTIVSTSLVVTHLQSFNQTETDRIQNYTASDVTQATSDSIKAELNEALHTSISAAMYDMGKASKGTDSVENKIINYMNSRIMENWDYPNIEVRIPTLDKKSTYFNWRPDGSLSVETYLKSELEHVKGPMSYGMVLKADVNSRFMRIKNITRRILEKASKINMNNVKKLEKDLNSDYKCEGIRINLYVENNRLKINVKDIYGSKGVIIQK